MLQSTKPALAETAAVREMARKVRTHIVKMTHRARCSHTGSGLSLADVVASLYGGGVLNHRPSEPKWPARDRLILSKGHAAACQYAVLAEAGFFPSQELEKFCTNDSYLAGHVNHNVPGVEASTGSLGHGLSIGCGMALVGKTSEPRFRVFVILSDGECDEGSTWEPALLAPTLKLSNLTVIVDYNKIQSLGTVKEVLDLEPLADKWRSFGWAVEEVDGHDVEALLATLGRLPFETDKPSCIIAHTVKGKGVSFMENQLIWHYYSPDKEELEKALAELGETV
ncbi:MAG: hypothetical protein AMXMBFR33_65960 [Candidatus Xenobia bacterium]